MPSRDPVPVEDLAYIRQTDKALLFDHGGNEVWIPKSQAALIDGRDFDDIGDGELIAVQVPEWLAMKEGLI